MHICSKTPERWVQTGSAGKDRTRRFLGAAALVLAAAVGIWGLYRPASRATLPQLTRSELELRDGKLYRIGHAQPFTGVVVERRSDGSWQSRSAVSNGLLHGVSEGWHTNGQLAVREPFRAGISHGLREKWYPSGAKMSEATIVLGKLQGTFRRWHENGTVAEQIEMQGGQAEGLSLAYYPSGYLKAKATLHRGQLTERQFWRDGERSK